MKNKVKIVVLCNDRFPSLSAHGVYLAKLCDSLSGAGAEVTLIVPKRFNEIAEDYRTFYNVKNNFKVVRIFSFDFIIFARFLKGLAYWLQYLNFYLFVFAYFLFSPRDRVIYTMDYFGPLLKLLGFKVVFESHQGLGSHKAFWVRFVKLADLLVVTNSYIAGLFTSFFSSEKILVARNGVDLKDFESDFDCENFRRRTGLPLDRKIVSYIGKFRTMGKGKGVEELIEIFPKVFSSCPQAYLMIVGVSEDEKRELESILSQKSGVQAFDYKIVLQVSQQEIPNYLKASDILVMNYPNKEHYAYFMSPMKMFEYMASGRPIVSTDLPSIREVLADSNAVLVQSENIEDLTVGILRVLNDHGLAEKISARAKKDVREYSWDKRAEKILNFIASR